MVVVVVVVVVTVVGVGVGKCLRQFNESVIDRKVRMKQCTAAEQRWGLWI